MAGEKQNPIRVRRRLLPNDLPEPQAKAQLRSRSIHRLFGPRPVAQDEEDHIRELAYRLYEKRGRTDGDAEQDWLEAQAIIGGEREVVVW